MTAHTTSLLTIALFASAAPAFHASAQVFRGLGDLPGGSSISGAYKVSRDGTTVVGYGAIGIGEQYNAFRWTPAAGMVSLGDFPGGQEDGSYAYSVNADGSVIVGTGTEISQPYLAFRWTPSTGLVGLGDSDNNPSTSSFATDVSDDGTVIAFSGGFAGDGAGGFLGMACRWTSSSGLTPLGFFPGGTQTYAAGISADGAVIVGGGTIPSGGHHAFRWTQAAGLVSLGDLPGGEEYSFAEGVSSDGAVIVGHCSTPEGRFAMRWTQSTGMVSLGDLPGGPTQSFATAVSDDGNTVVGIANSTYNVDFNGEAFIWTAQRGMRSLKDAVMADFSAPELEGWRLVSAWGVSGNGRVIVGEGINPQGNWEAYVINLDAGPCRADFNGDGVVNSQDFFDFLAAFFAGC